MRAWMLAGLVLVCAPLARGQDVHAAAAAFGEGQRAQLRGDFARAAELFEVADQAAPSPEALRSAIRNHRAAAQLARAATLSVRAIERYPEDAETRALAEETLAEAQAQLGALHVACDPACAITIDGRAAGEGTAIHLFVDAGAHRVGASWPERGEATREIEVTPGSSTDVRLAPPEPEPEVEPEPEAAPTPPAPVQPPPRRGLGPELFGVGVAITAFGAGLAIWSGVDTLAARDIYVENPSRARYENGVTLEWRTTGLWIATAAVGVTSAILAFFTDFGGGALVALAPTPGGAYAMIGGTFDEAER